MSNYTVKADSIDKSFGRRLIFENLSFEYSGSGIFGVSGPNGSGKSTLVKIIAGLITPNKGKIIHKNNGEEIISEKLHNHLGFVSPYLVLYDEFTAWENLNYFAQIRGIDFDEKKVKDVLEKFLLYNRKDDIVKTYSSGMKQRLKFAFALMHSPELFIFDEPTSNLDDRGKEVVYDIVKEEGEKNIVIIASNEKSDLALCTEILNLEEYKFE